MNMPAVGTDPGRLLGLFEHGLPFDVGKQGIIPFHMLLFDFRNQLKQDRNIIESFFPGLLRKIGIHLLPLVLLPGRCILEVFGGGGHLAVVENPEPDFRMFLFIVCGLIEDVANLLVTVLPRFRCEIGVLVARLRFPRKRSHQIGFGFRAFENFHKNSLPFAVLELVCTRGGCLIPVFVTFPIQVLILLYGGGRKERVSKYETAHAPFDLRMGCFVSGPGSDRLAVNRQ